MSIIPFAVRSRLVSRRVRSSTVLTAVTAFAVVCYAVAAISVSAQAAPLRLVSTIWSPFTASGDRTGCPTGPRP